MREAGIDPASQVILAAVSGGADSTALLLCLIALARAMKDPSNLCACYVDHGLRERGEIAAEIAQLRTLCDSQGIPLVVERADVLRFQRARRFSAEDAARRVRYAALKAVAARTGAEAVATGHTGDDQVETVLLRLIRGTGVRGLAGMEARAYPWGIDGPPLLRPLLSLSRADTEGYCSERGLRWCEDSSNSSPLFLRNRVRHELLPVLTGLRPGVPDALLRLSVLAREFASWNDAMAAEHLAILWSGEEGSYRLLRPSPPMHSFPGRQVVAAALARLFEGAGPPSARHVEAVYDLWTGRPGRERRFKGAWRAIADRDGVTFVQGAPER